MAAYHTAPSDANGLSGLPHLVSIGATQEFDWHHSSRRSHEASIMISIHWRRQNPIRVVSGLARWFGVLVHL
jgi:hypothetical protein